MSRRLAAVGSLPLIALGMVSTAKAAPPPTITCGATITQSVSLAADIGPCSGDGLVIQGDGVKVDLNGHTVQGPSTHTGSTVGIRIKRSNGVQVTGGTVTGFDAGVAIAGGSGNRLAGLTVADNIGKFGGDFCDGVAILDSPDNTLTGLEVRHNGPCDGIGVFGAGSTGELIQGNTVEDQTLPLSPSGSFTIDFGINLGSGFDTWPSSVTVRGNTVRNNGGDGILACSAFGIPCVTSDDSIIGNIVEHNGFYFGASTANRGFGGDGIRVVGNDFAGTDVFVTRNTVQGNTVTQNASNGIVVSTDQNSITGNTSLDNNQSHGFFKLDLKDVSSSRGRGGAPVCETNVWSGNTWGFFYNSNPSFGPVGLTNLGSYDPECASDKGTGPRPGARTIFGPATASASSASPAMSPQQVAPSSLSAQDQIPPTPQRQLSRLEA